MTKPCSITRADLLTIMEHVSFSRAVIAGADEKGVVIDGYLDLKAMAEQLNRLIAARTHSISIRENEQAR